MHYSTYEKRPEGYYSLTELKKRNWTNKTIEMFLGKEDMTHDNPFYRNAAPMRLWKQERVIEIEKSEKFTEAQEKSKNRREGAKKAVKTKTEALLNYINDLTIDLPNISLREIVLQSAKHYNTRQLELTLTRDYYNSDCINLKDLDKRSTEDIANDQFFQRISVNYIRHQLTHYEDQFAKLYGKVGTDQALMELRTKIYQTIGQKYPEFQNECMKQLTKRKEQFEMAEKWKAGQLYS